MKYRRGKGVGGVFGIGNPRGIVKDLDLKEEEASGGKSPK